MNGPVVLMGAMEGEISAFHQVLKNRTESTWNNYKFYEGLIGDRPVVIAKTGVGKVLSAMVTQHVIDNFKPSLLIFSGIAGAISPKLNIGDMVMGKDSVQHDMDARAFKYPRGHIPYTEYRYIESDQDIFRKALACRSSTGNIVGGRILSGDQFVRDSDSPEKSYLRDELKGDCIDMEGASVALVCEVNNIPHLLIRTISDKADGKEKVNLRKFLKESSENALAIILQILK